MSRERSRKSTAQASPPPEPSATGPLRIFRRPFVDFVGPGRRRTDHPLVVGTIVLCCGFIATGSVVQVWATFWAGSQVKVLLEKEQKRDASTESMRKTIIKFSESQATILRKVCLNTASSEKDRADCMVPVPEITPKATDH